MQLILLLPLLYLIVSPLPYQAHSFNDLDYASRLLLKGVKHFKFDVSLADRQSCSERSSWTPTAKCFASSLYVQEICCIAMRGDASSQPHFLSPFNTSTEFISLLDTFLSANPVGMLLVAIDFQFAFEINNFIVEEFVSELAHLLKKYSRLEVGIEKDWILEYDKMCRGPPNASEPCTSARKNISDSRIFLQSSSDNPFDPRNTANRFKNFNIFYKEIDSLCEKGFPSWAKKNISFPMIFWEPSNQQQIKYALDKLLSPSCQQKHNRTIQTIALASNIDPQMFATFMKTTKEVNPASNWQWMPQTQNIFLKNVTGVLMAHTNTKLITYWKYNILNILSVIGLNQQSGLLTKALQKQIVQQIIQIHGINDNFMCVSLRSLNLFGAYGKAVSLQLYNSALSVIKQTTLSNYIVSTTDGQSIYFLVGTPNPSFLNVLVTSDLDSVSTYSTFSMNEQLVKQIKSILVVKNNSIIVSGDDGKITWLAYIANDTLYNVQSVIYGINSKLELRQDTNIVIVVENSYCHSGLLLNNNAQNKCTLHLSNSTLPLASLKGLVNVMRTNVQGLKKVIERKKIVTACDKDNNFYKGFNGETTDVVSNWGKTFFSTKYLHVGEQQFLMLFSGGSNYGENLINANGWLLISQN